MDGRTFFLPVNVREITIPSASADSETEVLEGIPGYAFDEYRIVRPIGLPQEAMDAYQTALMFFAEAYQRQRSE